MLGAAAVRTKNIRLTSAVTVLSSDDPVRVFQEFSTIDLLSNGRAEIMAGRGSFIESFPLFGYDLGDYDSLFAENLELLLAVRENERVTWRGGHAPAITDRGVYPRPVQQPLPVWIAVGGTPASVVRAATLGLPLALAIIGGLPENFVPFVDLYRETGARLGVDPAKLKVGDQLARVRRRNVAGGRRCVLSVVRGGDDAHRQGARLAADHAPAVRCVAHTPRRAARRQRRRK